MTKPLVVLCLVKRSLIIVTFVTAQYHAEGFYHVSRAVCYGNDLLRRDLAGLKDVTVIPDVRGIVTVIEAPEKKTKVQTMTRFMFCKMSQEASTSTL